MSLTSLFRGTELPRLLVLVGVVALGWPLFWFYAGPRPEPTPLPRASAVSSLPPAEESEVFRAVEDRRPLAFRENAAYADLLARARTTQPETLASRSRRDVWFVHLWQTPARYRGIPIHLEGTALRVLTYEVPRTLAPSGRLYEAWVITPESRPNPYVVCFEEPPPDLPIGPDLTERVVVDAYFLKLMTYQAGDKVRHAPLLVGRLTHIPGAAEFTGTYSRSTMLWAGVVVAVLLTYGLLRLAFQAGRGPSVAEKVRQTLASTPPVDEISPEELAQALDNLSGRSEPSSRGDGPVVADDPDEFSGAGLPARHPDWAKGGQGRPPH